jgi:hypothetical protein
MTPQQTGYRRVIRSKRIMADHIAEVERVADELGKRGLIDLADDLRLSVRELKKL